jgi:hypothetical protein
MSLSGAAASTSAASSVRQLARYLRLIPELHSPVLEALQHQAVRFAVLSLVQIALTPGLMM